MPAQRRYLWMSIAETLGMSAQALKNFLEANAVLRDGRALNKATGKRFANLWLHSNHVSVNGEKISKSMGNGIHLREIIAKGLSAEAIRLARPRITLPLPIEVQLGQPAGRPEPPRPLASRRGATLAAPRPR